METAIDKIEAIEQSLDIIKTGPEILKSNSERKIKALAVGNNILIEIESKGMDASLDDRCRNYLANINKASKEIQENRKGITQIMDVLKKMYTTVEAEMDIKRDGTIPNKIQGYRDAYAKQLAEEAEKKRKELERQRLKEEEAINIKIHAEKTVSDRLINALYDFKNTINKVFNAISLTDFDTKEKSLKEMNVALPEVTYKKATEYINIQAKYHNADEIQALINQGIEQFDIANFEQRWESEIRELQVGLILKLPSKKNELLEIQKASKKEKERLEADRLKREQEEADKLKREQEEAKKKAEEEAEIKKQGEVTMNLFEEQAELAQIEQAPETRQGYEIIVSHPVAYTQIFAYWFEREGKNLGLDQLEKKSLGQMKSFCEKHAHKTGELIESKFIKYEPTYKAINRK